MRASLSANSVPQTPISRSPSPTVTVTSDWKSSAWRRFVSETSMPRSSAIRGALTALTCHSSGWKTPFSAEAVTMSTSSSAMSPS